ncbi:MAG TPA: hypothetical protein VHD90_21430 [Phototrophicaceae bacterium]|nr:hypothetical protein [Phototrophicaceae bacterium]
MSFGMRLGLALFAVCFTLPISPQADAIVGRWCDLSTPGHPLGADRIMTIRNRDAGAVELDSTFRDGSHLTQRLTERANATFAVVDSPSHDLLRIVQSTGNLQLLDDDGFIREARRLGNTPRRDECLR